MIRVRFKNEHLVDETGKPVISEEKLVEKCIENISYSPRVIEIVKYTIKSLGYELVDDKMYRRSSIFNKIEDTILNSSDYKRDTFKAPEQPKRDPAERYILDYKRQRKLRIASYAARRPARFGKRG